jgi:hypothetical protein
MTDWEPTNLDTISTEEKTTKSQREQRIEICKTCDRLSLLKFCKECHCYMPLKTYIKSVSCPLEKW